jgi:hypothetical protein
VVCPTIWSTDAAAMHEASAAVGAEGTASKQIDSPYRPGRSRRGSRQSTASRGPSRWRGGDPPPWHGQVGSSSSTEANRSGSQRSPFLRPSEALWSTCSADTGALTPPERSRSPMTASRPRCTSPAVPRHTASCARRSSPPSYPSDRSPASVAEAPTQRDLHGDGQSAATAKTGNAAIRGDGPPDAQRYRWKHRSSGTKVYLRRNLEVVG